jgi:rfaE bifunctional protein kinase chain/domain
LAASSKNQVFFLILRLSIRDVSAYIKTCTYNFEIMNSQENTALWVTSTLSRLPQATITVFGDFCLDAYWVLDTEAAETSIETGLPLHRVREQRYSLGGAGSVVANLAAMGVGRIQAIGAVGQDMFGGKTVEILKAHNVDTDGFFFDESLQTMVYAKPHSGDTEHNRVDFGAFNVYSEGLIHRLLERLEMAFATSDCVILNQQVPASISLPPVIERINDLIAAFPEKLCIVDARHYADCYAGAILKLNMHEAARVLKEPETAEHTSAQAAEYAKRLHAHSGRPAFLTRGEHGLIAADADGILIEVPGLKVSGPIDTVGAGDSVIAGLAAAMAVGETVGHAAEFANIAASITVRQLQCTGTASAEQILAAIPALQYVSLPYAERSASDAA